jgi:hypothetical protein
VATPSLNASFSSVAGAASTDVWAVGSQAVHNSTNTLIEHWNGTTWSVVTSPKLPDGSRLSGVTAPATNNVWAEGVEADSANALIEHWDGSSWSLVSSPAFAGLFTTAISADAATDVWAVGDTTGNTPSLHWDGTSWTLIPTVHLRFGGVSGLFARSPTDVWAVGTGPGTPSGGCSAHPAELIEHWNGIIWTVVPSVNPFPCHNDSMLAVAADAATDAWAVGGGPALTEHWDGTSWSLVEPPSQVASLLGLTALSSGLVLAVGGGTNGSGIILSN